ncbi:uncharacterized protein PV07_04639 [Cladophialophora immunda]|uniref:Uncharacterized protein n=1 Tax=Cladophialophora immunda TaxID=569365 RepID=A0A0D2CER4_9EURO|nr:uncharacterized protein PV07_04639 [Cladophialophora immunda]KIW28765.1 hypothetical protein PV07_04639 [Cladophialophora immunda]
MDKDEKVKDAIPDCGANFNTNTSANGKHGMTKSELARANKQKIADRERGATQDERVEFAGLDMDAACEQFEEKMTSRGYRPFVDQSGFMYLFTLIREDILKNRLEKHRIKVRYAPDFASQHDTKSSMYHQASEGKHQGPRKGKVFRPSEDPESNSRLPFCPVPLYFFPKPYPFSRNPVIGSALPQDLRPSNPKLRVHIPDPYALSLQLFESDLISTGRRSTRHTSSASVVPQAGSRRNVKTYACYSINTRSGMIWIQTLAPVGSTFDLAWDMFCKFFNMRVGVEWTDVYEGWKKGIHCVQPLSEKPLGEDGADDGEGFRGSKPSALQFRDGQDEAAVESIETRSRKPSVTVLMNMHEHIMDERLEVQAKTPESGW